MAFEDIGSAGSGSIASAFVSIGADLSALRAGEEEVKAIVSRIGQYAATINLGGGSGGGGGFSSSPNLGPSIGGSGVSIPGGTTGVMSLGSNPSMGSIGGVFSSNPNMGAQVGFGSVGGGNVEQAIAQATQTAVQGAIARVQQQVASAVEGYAAQVGGGGMTGFRSNLGAMSSYFQSNFINSSSIINGGPGGGYMGDGFAGPGGWTTGIVQPPNQFSSSPPGGFYTGRYSGAGGVGSVYQQMMARGAPTAYTGDGFGGMAAWTSGISQPPNQFNTSPPGAFYTGAYSGYGGNFSTENEVNTSPPGSFYVGGLSGEGSVGGPRPDPATSMALRLRMQQNRSLFYKTINGLDAEEGASTYRGFGVPGVISRITGIPYAGVVAGLFAGYEANRLGGEYARTSREAAYVNQNPDITLGRLGSVGSGLGLYNDAGIRSAASEYDSLQGDILWGSLINQIPVIGGYDLPGVAEAQHRQQRLSEYAASRSAFGELGYRTAAMNTERTLDQSLTFQQENVRGLRSAEERYAAIQDRYNSLPGFNADYIQQQHAQNPGADLGEQGNRFIAELKNASDAIASFRSAISGTADAISSRQQSAINVTNANAMANSVLANGGSPLTAMGIRQTAEGMSAANDFLQTPIFSSPGVINATGLAQSWANMGGVAAQQEKERFDYGLSVAGIGYEGAAAYASARGLGYAAREQGLMGQLASMSMGNPRRSVAESELSGLGGESEYQTDVSMSGIGSSIASARLRSSRRFYEARVNDFNTQFRNEVANLDTSRPGAARLIVGMMREHSAGLSAMATEHAQDLQLEREGYAATVAESEEIMALRPISSNAVRSIASARRMVELADPKNRENAIAAGRASLRAAAFELTAQRGGEVGIDMSLTQAVGSMYATGIDLTGRKADIGRAQNLYRNGANDLDTAKLTGTSGEGFDQESKNNLAVVARWAEKALSSPMLIGLFKK